MMKSQNIQNPAHYSVTLPSQYRPFLSSLLAVTILCVAVAFSSPSFAATETNANHTGTLLRAVVLNMGRDAAHITDGIYDRYFKQGTATNGVAAVIASGKFSINGLPIPASSTEFQQRTPDGYKVNQVNWLSYNPVTHSWMGGYHAQRVFANYDAAALAVATDIVPGLEMRLYDTDGDGFADTIDADYKEGVQVQDIIRHQDGSVSVRRGDISQRSTEDGKVFDGSHFSAASDERILVNNFDSQITPGDVALFWWGPTGWVMQRAREIRGMFTDGHDHESYIINNIAYQDAMHFSRDNLFISNRPGEFANAQKFFALNGNSEDLQVSLWLVPTTDPMAFGAPIGMTSGNNARRFLSKAIAQAQHWLSDISSSVNGRDIPATRRWVVPSLHAQLAKAIIRAQSVLDSKTSTNSQLDYQVYMLYLTLNGSEDDIGARFGGYHQQGFVRTAQNGLLSQLQP